jgi:hypothetical protein
LGRKIQPRATRGSQRWLQELVAADPGRLDEAIGLGRLEWLSPLESDDWAEYRDQAFLDLLGVALETRPLSSFWPHGGPVWDGLARTFSGQCVLVEAKAHVSEMASTCAAASPASIAKIRAALDETKAVLGVDSERDWCEGFYQYANRLAHAHLMNDLNSVPTHLLFLNFVGDLDMNGPATQAEWESAINSAHEALGVQGKLPAYVREAFVSVAAG